MSLSQLGMRLIPGYTVRAVTGGFAPDPRGIRQDQIIGTGRADGVSGVGGPPIERNEGDGGEMTAAEIQEQQDYFDSTAFAGAYSPDKEYPETLAGYLEKALDYALAPHVEFNSLTQSYRATSPGGIIEAAMGPLAGFMAAGAALSKANLENINEQALAGTPGYAVGLFDNAILGVSPNAISTGLFGMSPTEAGVLSGTIPDAPPGITQEAYNQAIMTALLDAVVPATPPGIGPSTSSIPDVTAAVNQEVYGSPSGADALANTTGMVFSYTQNPFGKPGMMKNPVMTKENLPVTMGGWKSSDFGFDPDFGYDPYDDTNPVQDTAFFDDELDVTPGVTSDISTANEYGDPTAPGGGEFGGSSPSSGNTGNTGTTGNTGSTSMGSNSGMSGPGDMGGGDDNGKIVCTAINLTYGLPMYTNKVWLAYNRKHNLDGAWELGYHKLFYPLVKRMNNNRLIHNFLIWFAKTRTHGVKEHMRGNKFTVRTLFLKPVLGSIVYLTGKAIQAGLLKKVEVDVKSLISKNISKQDR